jgi:hypothetical protein
VLPSPAAPPQQAPSAQQALEEALATLLVTSGEDLPAAPPGAVEPPAVSTTLPPRVQLGFRDGTSTSLDPSSSQSQALEELAQSLTRRD